MWFLFASTMAIFEYILERSHSPMGIGHYYLMYRMKDYFEKLIHKEGLRLALLFMIVIVCLNVILVIYYRNVIDKNSETNRQVQLIKDEIYEMEHYTSLAEMAVRGYLIQQNDPLLDPYVEARDNYQSNLKSLEKNIHNLDYDINKMKPASSAIVTYMNSIKLMIDLCKTGRVDEAIAIFGENGNKTVQHRIDPFFKDLGSFLENLRESSQESFRNSMNSILIIQIILIILSLPVLILFYRNIIKESQFKSNIFTLIDESNKSYLFDDGLENNEENKDTITERLVSNLKKAVGFINHITKGEYNIEWEGMDQKNRHLNKNNIAGELIMMRDQMIKVKKEDEIRIWINEGLSKFADMIRTHQNDLKYLSDSLISQIVVYLGAQQGGLFFLSEDDHKKKYLELMGCYAYERKKFQEKRIEIGQGMVGQCFLEGETTYITNLPQEYVNITSGLGDANPNILLIVPLKLNEEVVGIIEIACLKEIAPYKIEFMEKLAETIASSITSVKTNEQTRILLEQSQQQGEEMRAQEEEMRQNLEELQATQEQMHRKNEEVEGLLKQTSENEKNMKIQMEKLEKLQQESDLNNHKIQQEAEDFKNMLMDILNEIPQKVFLKDAEGKIYIANKKVSDAHGLPLSELIGKSDYDFVDKETADDWRRQELEIMKKGEEKYIFEDTIGGKRTTLESTKKRFNIKPLNQKGLLGIQNDISERVNLEAEIKKLKGNKS